MKIKANHGSTHITLTQHVRELDTNITLDWILREHIIFKTMTAPDSKETLKSTDVVQADLRIIRLEPKHGQTDANRERTAALAAAAAGYSIN